MSPKTVFSSVALVIALGSLEKSIVTTPLPIIGVELNAGAALTWVVTAYLLAATAALPIYGKLSDMFSAGYACSTSVSACFWRDPWPAPWPRICRPC